MALAAAEAARQERARASGELKRARDQLAPLLAPREQIKQLSHDEQEWQGRCAAFEVPEGAPLQLTGVGALRAGDLAAADAVLAALRVLWTAAGDLVAVLRTDTSDARLTELRAQHLPAEESVTARKEAARMASAQEEQGKLLQRATTRAVTAVTSKRFKRLAPTVQDIYGRLDPHPSFKTLDFNLDVYRQKGIASPVARDEAESVDADPLLVFSSSQANVTALLLPCSGLGGRTGRAPIRPFGRPPPVDGRRKRAGIRRPLPAHTATETASGLDSRAATCFAPAAQARSEVDDRAYEGHRIHGLDSKGPRDRPAAYRTSIRGRQAPFCSAPGRGMSTLGEQLDLGVRGSQPGGTKISDGRVATPSCFGARSDSHGRDQTSGHTARRIRRPASAPRSRRQARAQIGSAGDRIRLSSTSERTSPMPRGGYPF